MKFTSSVQIMRDLVSTIIPVYNRAIFLSDAVLSVLNQTHRPIEIILVDDGSTDDTSEKIAELVAQHADTIRSLRIENSGPGGAREQGRLIARGEFIQYLDSDDLLWPDKFAVQVEALKRHHHCGVAYGKTRLVDGNGKEIVAPFKLSGQQMDQLFPALLVDRWWNTHTPLYRKSVCDEVGPWPMMRMGEDWLYDARVGALGTKLVFCDEFVSDHRQHQQARLTGGTLTGSALRDFGVLLPELLRCAVEAGVQHDCAEMRHLSRWAFSISRQLGRIGESHLAEQCLQVACDADHEFTNRIEYRAFSSFAHFLGWRFSGYLFESLRSLRNTKTGASSMQQTWTQHEIDSSAGKIIENV